MEQIAGKYFIEAGELKPVEEFHIIGNNDIQLYEVLRVISGIPLFLEDHLERLRNSILKSGIFCSVDLEEIKKDVLRLISENQSQVGNIKIVLHFAGQKLGSQFYFIPHKYPGAEDYLKGVPVALLKAERSNPEAKVIQAELRDKANKMIAGEKVYEVLLVDHEGNIREGSRSNVFFVKGSQIITPPVETVLNGITRKKVVGILESGDYGFKECPVALENLGSYDCLFLTGTSPKVLPISRVGNLEFDPRNQLCRSVASEYNKLIDDYIAGKNNVES